MVEGLTAATTAVPQLVPVKGGADMPIWSILNHFFDFPSHDEKEVPQSYIHTMTGPCWWVHWAQMAVMLEPADMVAFNVAEVPPLQVIMASETDKTGL